MLETRTRFKEDCDCACLRASRATSRSVGNQDSLQRGLRQDLGGQGHDHRVPVGNQDSLQRGLRLSMILGNPRLLRSPLETRTRFKEDCDGAPERTAAIITFFMLETRTRFKEDCDRGYCSRNSSGIQGWKPGLASKRIATSC